MVQKELGGQKDMVQKELEAQEMEKKDRQWQVEMLLRLKQEKNVEKSDMNENVAFMRFKAAATTVRNTNPRAEVRMNLFSDASVLYVHVDVLKL